MELPLVAYGILDKLAVNKTHGKFADRFSNVSVFEVSGLRNHFAAFVYMCRLNLDLDGASNTYGYDNPAKGSIQKHLDPLESWHKGQKGVSHSRSEKVGSAMLAVIPTMAQRDGKTSSLATATSIGSGSRP